MDGCAGETEEAEGRRREGTRRRRGKPKREMRSSLYNYKTKHTLKEDGRIMKKFISFVMAAAMVASLVPATAFAKGDVTMSAKVLDKNQQGQQGCCDC